MHIKQVLISGFKSFRSQSEIEEFSPHHNVIVGRNGSGKSNFFDAIQFVLGAPKFATLRQEDRQNLLHEGAGSSVMAAYVEIVFDNSDGRMSVESDEVIIRRTVGHKKDEFFLNRKRIQKSEVISLLESAGFSKSNPYYIVQQGKVANLCTMKDADRLHLLKEVAGTSVYEERRAESMKILQETALKKEKVQEVLGCIEERLAELEQEKAELTEYESLDKQRRAIEYNIYYKEQTSAQDSLHQLDALRENHSRDLRNQHQQLQAAQEEISTEEAVLETHRALVTRLDNKLTNKKAELSQYRISRDNNLNEILELENKEFLRENEIHESNQLLERVNQNIATKEAELQQVDATIAQTVAQSSGITTQLMALQSKQEILANKRNKHGPYNTRKERDAYIKSHLQTLSNAIASKEKLLQDYRQLLQSSQQSQTSQQAKLQRDEQQHAENSRTCNQWTQEINQLLNRRNQLQEERKKSWQALEKHNENLLVLKQDLGNSKAQLNRVLPYAVAQGLTIIESIVAEKQIEGYYGPLIDNIEIRNPLFNTVLDKAGGLGLFHIVVDTDDTANTLIKILEQKNVGRLTFLPLSRLRVPQVEYPKDDSVKPLVEVALTFEDYMAPAVQLVFGSKLLARDLASAAESAAKYRLDTFTIEGDLVSARGALEGGYHNAKLSKIQSIENIRKVTSQMDDINKQVKALTERNNELESAINDVLKQISKLEMERDHLFENNMMLFKEIAVTKKDAKEAHANMQTREASIQQIEQEIGNQQQQLQIYQQELQSPFVKAITEAELAALQEYEQQIKALQTQLDQCQQTLVNLQQTRNGILQELQQNLYKSKEEAEMKINAYVLNAAEADVSLLASEEGGSGRAGVKDLRAEIDKLQLENRHVETLIEGVQAEIESIQRQLQELNSQMAGSEQQLETLRQREQSVAEQIALLNKDYDKALNKKNIFLDTISSKTKLIKELGILPQVEVQRFARFAVHHLHKELVTVNNKLAKYSNINRKALDQYLSFANQKELLFSRQKELDNEDNSISLLVQNLDVQKDNSIMTTFQNVNTHFMNVFTELIPAGKAKLVLRTSMDGDEEEEDLAAAAGHVKNVSNIIGIAVEVSFTSTNGRHVYHPMAALSGGQKALVALALIFAIQRCDPAPFYLFDEIDQALDSNHRLAVAKMIQKQVTTDPSVYAAINVNKPVKDQHYSSPQFITTTFRPELVQVADKWFGIALQNKVSNIFPLEQAQAESFVTDLLMEEEAVGRVSAVPQYRPQDAHGRDAMDDDARRKAVGRGDGRRGRVRRRGDLEDEDVEEQEEEDEENESEGGEDAGNDDVELDDDAARVMGFR